MEQENLDLAVALGEVINIHPALHGEECRWEPALLTMQRLGEDRP